MIRNEKWQQDVEIKYNYSRKDCYESIEWEREPVRTMKITDPRDYHGQLRKHRRWLNSSKVWVVNGVITKSDATFKTNFHFSTIGDTGIYIGNHPHFEDEIKSLRQAGVTAVINLRTDTNDF